jgi:hypothetical protein
MKDRLSDPIYTERNYFNVKVENGEYALYDKKGTITFTLNTKTNEISYNASIGTPTLFKSTAKLPKKEFNKILDCVKFAQSLENETKTCFIDLIDDGFNVELIDINFTNGTFAIKISDEYRTIDMELSTLRRCIKRLMVNLDVNIDDDRKFDRESARFRHKNDLALGLFIKTPSMKEDIIYNIEGQTAKHFSLDNSGTDVWTASTLSIVQNWNSLFEQYSSRITIPFKRK